MSELKTTADPISDEDLAELRQLINDADSFETDPGDEFFPIIAYAPNVLARIDTLLAERDALKTALKTCSRLAYMIGTQPCDPKSTALDIASAAQDALDDSRRGKS